MRQSSFRDIRGQRFGRWAVLDDEPLHKAYASGYVIYWRCRCDCGTERLVQGRNLWNGRTASCGCYKAEVSKELNTEHGMCGTPEYETWVRMIQRCHNSHNPGYKWYGARGIAVTDAWRASFNQFLRDMGPRPAPQYSIERVDNEKGYQPDNCIWADPRTQANNQRKNRLITWNGKTQTLAEWSRQTGLSISAIHKRLTYFGWSVDEALTIPIRSVRHKR